MVNCKKCDADISDSYQSDEPDVGIVGGWYCDACDLAIGEHEVDREPLPDDVPISFIDHERKIGTPASELSGRPSTKGFVKFCRIARSWGYP